MGWDYFKKNRQQGNQFQHWDVELKTLRKSGRLENLKSEIDKCELNVVGLSEVRWPGNEQVC